MKKRFFLTSLLVGVLAVACTDGAAPPLEDEAVVQAAAMQPIAWQTPSVGMSDSTPAGSGSWDARIPRSSGIATTDDSASVWAVRGEGTYIYMFRHVLVCDDEGHCADDKVRHSSITVPANALLTRPDGTPIAQGDSVLISLVADENTSHVHLYPSGLQFDPNAPVILRVYYDASGMSSSQEDALEMWYQAQLNDPWSMIQAEQDNFLGPVHC